MRCTPRFIHGHLAIPNHFTTIQAVTIHKPESKSSQYQSPSDLVTRSTRRAPSLFQGASPARPWRPALSSNVYATSCAHRPARRIIPHFQPAPTGGQRWTNRSWFASEARRQRPIPGYPYTTPARKRGDCDDGTTRTVSQYVGFFTRPIPCRRVYPNRPRRSRPTLNAHRSNHRTHAPNRSRRVARAPPFPPMPLARPGNDDAKLNNWGLLLRQKWGVLLHVPHASGLTPARRNVAERSRRPGSRVTSFPMPMPRTSAILRASVSTTLSGFLASTR